MKTCGVYMSRKFDLTDSDGASSMRIKKYIFDEVRRGRRPNANQIIQLMFSGIILVRINWWWIGRRLEIVYISLFDIRGIVITPMNNIGWMYWCICIIWRKLFLERLSILGKQPNKIYQNDAKMQVSQILLHNLQF